MKKTHIVVASDFTLFRNGLKLIIEKEESFRIVGEASSVNEIFSLLQSNVPDIILLNLNLESESLQSLCENLHMKFPNLPILLFMNNNIESSLPELIVRGVRGVIWKDNSSDNLIDVIECVAGGRLYFEDPENCRINCLLSDRISENQEDIDINQTLSERETEVLQLIAKGMTYKQIADNLTISSRTVETHKNNILTKLNLKNKNELIRYAVKYLCM